ncbi:hypothetical protein BS78_02G035000 [Paspalum vaginatum]|nr:hypothetical protein BS78_02G035000 [Paspalum vaginatum]
MYTQMACGLSQRLKVLRVGAVFASALLRAIRFLQLHWEQLAAHIEAARLIPRRTRPSASGGGRAPAPGLGPRPGAVPPAGHYVIYWELLATSSCKQSQAAAAEVSHHYCLEMEQ